MEIFTNFDGVFWGSVFISLLGMAFLLVMASGLSE